MRCMLPLVIALFVHEADVLTFYFMSSKCARASLAQLAEHALRKRMVVGSIPTGG
jgi:hypothetical protein